jgi:hypothetical protein
MKGQTLVHVAAGGQFVGHELAPFAEKGRRLLRGLPGARVYVPDFPARSPGLNSSRRTMVSPKSETLDA